MEGDILFSLIKEKQKRIQDLEKMVEDQKRLRMEDANQVEEKAAKIKSWVVNKLEELEKQNKQLREQNKKQKDVVESLVTKLATLDMPRDPSPIYDSVSAEQTFFQKISKDPHCLAIRTNDIKKNPHDDVQPPPKPAHQIDLWEIELYKLAESEQEISATLDPIYITVTTQAVIDRKIYQLSPIPDIDHATKYERSLMLLMRSSSRRSSGGLVSNEYILTCPWNDKTALFYSNTPVQEALTSLGSETLCREAVELFKSILLFTQVPIEPVAIDYHVSLLQNCFARFIKHPELRNELFSQLIKQCTYVHHQCSTPRTPTSTKKRSSFIRQRSDSSTRSLSPSMCGGCKLITDLDHLDYIQKQCRSFGASSTISQFSSPHHQIDNYSNHSASIPPSKSELLQTMQMLSIAVSLDLPNGRIRCWLVECLRQFCNVKTTLGKYALYTLKALDRTGQNGKREQVPSRMEIMSILSRNPYDHSSPHSLPVSFADDSQLLIAIDGSTTVEEFMTSIGDSIDIRNSPQSDFHLFSDDATGARELHILKPQQKILDVVGWWEQLCRLHNCGKYQNTRAIKLLCKKRLLLKTSEGETQHEKKLIMHQIHQEIVEKRIIFSDSLVAELAAIMAQSSMGNYKLVKGVKLGDNMADKISKRFLPETSSQFQHVIERWNKLCGLSTQDCVKVYLNCIRRLKLSE